MSKQTTLSVAAIEHGTVIDHIAAGQGLRIVQILKLAKSKRTVTIGLNLPSQSTGIKDIVKVADVHLSEEDTNKIAILAPGATVNTIQEYQIIHKQTLAIPTTIEGILYCPNTNCISNQEPVTHRYQIKKTSSGIEFTCHYCEKIFSGNENIRYIM